MELSCAFHLQSKAVYFCAECGLLCKSHTKEEERNGHKITALNKQITDIYGIYFDIIKLRSSHTAISMLQTAITSVCENKINVLNKTQVSAYKQYKELLFEIDSQYGKKAIAAITRNLAMVSKMQMLIEKENVIREFPHIFADSLEHIKNQRSYLSNIAVSYKKYSYNNDLEQQIRSQECNKRLVITGKETNAAYSIAKCIAENDNIIDLGIMQYKI